MVLSILAIGIHCFLEGMKSAKVRYQVFTEDYIKQHLSAESEELKKGLGEPIKKGCHPDGGLGRFSAHLSTVDWTRFQLAQRVHQNYLETLTFALLSILFAGAFYPLLATAGALSFLFGRILFGIGFRSRPAARGPGFAITMLSLFALAGLAAHGALRLTNLI
ncbi:MAG: MAPEG family protein [archaeon]|nr:MAPEG family protein [archaeon]